MLTLSAALVSAVSACAFHLASAHCLWPRPAALVLPARIAGWVLFALALWLWIQALGVGVGLCIMLGCWMLAALLLPWLAACIAPAPTRGRR